jgi:protein involved in polysaccharide export with SLBB domain
VQPSKTIEHKEHIFMRLNHVLTLFIALLSINVSALETQQLEDEVLAPLVQDDVPVFGHALFNGSFKDQPFKGFNPDYLISNGDQINLQLWGAFTYTGLLEVDPQGNIFIPEVGPIRVLGITNKDLNAFVLDRVKRVFKKNVQVYTSLTSAQPVKVFVTGEVNQPGLYHGFSSDSVLYYLDSAGGILSNSGSYIHIEVKRNGEILTIINLYDFILKGDMPKLQLRNGDAIVIGKKKNVVQISGAVNTPGIVEFDKTLSFKDLLKIVRPSANANYARIIEVNNGIQQARYIALDDISEYPLQNGSLVELVKDSAVKTIAISVAGENLGPAEYILPYGATLSELTEQLKLMDTADKSSIQLYRQSVAQRQKIALDRSLDALQTEVLIQPNISTKEGTARVQMATLVGNFIKQARQVQPKGQVVLANSEYAGDMLLEDGDELIIPVRTSTISVVGEVIFPTALVFNDENTIEDYINLAGGFANRANTDSLVVLHRDGTIDRVEDSNFDDHDQVRLKAGDEIMVMPEITLNNLEIASDVTRIIYNIAVAAAAVLSI